MPTSSPVTRPLPRICTGADGATPCLPHSLRQKVRAVESTGSGTHWHPGHEARPPPVTEKLSQAWGRCSRISNLRADLSGALSASAARTPPFVLGAWCRGALRFCQGGARRGRSGLDLAAVLLLSSRVGPQVHAMTNFARVTAARPRHLCGQSVITAQPPVGSSSCGITSYVMSSYRITGWKASELLQVSVLG